MTAPSGRSADRLTDAQKFNWVRLIRTERVGPVTFRQLINRYGSAASALAALPEMAARGGTLRGIRIAPEDAIAAEFETLHRLGGRFIAMGEPEYPVALRQLENAPPVLAVVGDPAAMMPPMVGIVGSRNASTNGLKFARTLARDLASAGFAVVSGLARGIDRAAHEGALAVSATGAGTVAVLACGLDRPYPPQNVDIFERIANARFSCAVSAMPMGHEPMARDFPRRNAIIAGMALGVVIVEASERSGSLITATMATDAGRLVFAVPGHPMDPRSAGTNALLRDGAELIRHADDVLEVLRPLGGVPPAMSNVGESGPPSGDFQPVGTERKTGRKTGTVSR